MCVCFLSSFVFRRKKKTVKRDKCSDWLKGEKSARTRNKCSDWLKMKKKCVRKNRAIENKTVEGRLN